VELGLPDPELRPPFHQNFDAQFEVVLHERPAVFSFVFGRLGAAQMVACREAGIYTIGTATTIDEGLALEASGVDAVAAQGMEAGGHRGMFSADDDDLGLSTMVLTRALVARLKIPVIAAGGLMDGRDIAAARVWGAAAAMLGTAFLLCDEAATSPAYRQALARAGTKVTRLTRAFSGRWARGLENRFLREMAGSPAILPWPAQNSLTRDLRQKAAKENNPEFLSLWAGQGVERITRGPAGKIVERIFAG